MKPVMTPQTVREFEKAQVARGLDDMELMSRAGAIVAVQAAGFIEGGMALVICGSGNNGGDGWVAADNLARHGYEACVVTIATPAVMKRGAARRAATRASEMGVPVHTNPSLEEFRALLSHADVVVDAMFGTGFKGVMPDPYDSWCELLNQEYHGVVLSVDIPSGVDALTGKVEGNAVVADLTVTMFAAKPGLICDEGAQLAGRVMVANLLDGSVGEEAVGESADAFMVEDIDYLEAVPDPNPFVDKYGHGRVLVVAGSIRYTGAAMMAAIACARSGAGYVTLAVPEPIVAVVQMRMMSIPVVGLASDADGSFGFEAAAQVVELAKHADCVLAGPGMTLAPGPIAVVRSLLECPVPLVLDADGVNALGLIARGGEGFDVACLRREAPLVLTPHRRELARLLGVDPGKVTSLASSVSSAQALVWNVGSQNMAVLAKGPESAAVTLEGTLIPESGPSALATAGTGDVLAGILTGLLAQRFAADGPDIDPLRLGFAICAAHRVHGICAERAIAYRGSRGVMAEDLLDNVGLALDDLEALLNKAIEQDLYQVDQAIPGEGIEEHRIVPPPELAALIKADVEHARALERAARGEVGDDLESILADLEEPEPAKEAGPAVTPVIPEEGDDVAAGQVGDVPADADDLPGEGGAGDDPVMAPCDGDEPSDDVVDATGEEEPVGVEVDVIDDGDAPADGGTDAACDEGEAVDEVPESDDEDEPADDGADYACDESDPVGEEDEPDADEADAPDDEDGDDGVAGEKTPAGDGEGTVEPVAFLDPGVTTVIPRVEIPCEPEPPFEPEPSGDPVVGSVCEGIPDVTREAVPAPVVVVASEPAPEPQAAPLTPEEEERLRMEAFHERATLRVRYEGNGKAPKFKSRKHRR